MNIVKEAANDFSEHKALRLAAATAYYAIFSIGPLLVLVVGLAGVVFGEDRVSKELGRQLQSVVGANSAKIIESMMAAQHKGGSLTATILGAIALVIGVTGAFSQLQDSLNTIWEVTPAPGHSLWIFVRDRILSMAMVLCIGFLLLISMVLTTLVDAFADRISAVVSLPGWVAVVFNDAISFAVITLLFALIFKVLPDVKIRWRGVWVGGIGTALLFTLGKFLLGFYLSHETSASAYGAGSAFVVILLYVYYSSVILYFGAEFTQVYARHCGARLEPSRYAVHLTDPQRARQGMPRRQQLEAALRTRKSATPATAPPAAGPPPPIQRAMPTQVEKEPELPKKDVTLALTLPIQKRPFSFVGLALAAGFCAALLLRFRAARQALGFALAARHE